MKSKLVLDFTLLAVLLCGSLIGVPQRAWGQSFAGSADPAEIDGARPHRAMPTAVSTPRERGPSTKAAGQMRKRSSP